MLKLVCTLLLALLPASAWADPVEPLHSLVQKERAAVVETLRALVEV